MPWYMKFIVRQAQQHMYRDKMQVAFEEVMMYNKLAQSVRALIQACEPLMKAMTIGQHRLLEGVTSLSGMRRDAEESVANPRYHFRPVVHHLFASINCLQKFVFNF